MQKINITATYNLIFNASIMVADFMSCWRDGSLVRGRRLLTARRKELLNKIHAGQRKRDCLDYLMDELQQA